MLASEPGWRPKTNRSEPHESARSQHPAFKGALRALGFVTGLAVSALALVVVGLTAALSGCVGEETRGLCADTSWLVPVLEWPIFIAAVAAPLAGAVATFVRRDPYRLLAGVMTAVVMGLLMAAVATGQTSLLS